MVSIVSPESAARFRARVARFNEALTAVHELQMHICRKHPIDLDLAYELLPEYERTLVEEAVDCANKQPHDPFEGLA